MNTNIRGNRNTASGIVKAQGGVAYLHGFSGVATTAATIQYRSGGAGGTVIVAFDLAASHNATEIPGHGIRFDDGIYISMTGTITGLTTYYS